jgi:hypothetical protein
MLVGHSFVYVDTILSTLASQLRSRSFRVTTAGSTAFATVSFCRESGSRRCSLVTVLQLILGLSEPEWRFSVVIGLKAG